MNAAPSTGRLGRRDTLQNYPTFGCQLVTHEPFRMENETFGWKDHEERCLLGVVRTNGGQFEGDRSDVHDVFSIVWAAMLRAWGLTSPLLVDEEHMFVPGEMGARHLIFQQCAWGSIDDDIFVQARNAMNAWSAYAYHLLAEVFVWSRMSDPVLHSIDNKPPPTPEWFNSVKRLLRNPTDLYFSRRRSTNWTYCASLGRGVSIVQMAGIRIANLKALLAPYRPHFARGDGAAVVFANGICNGIPFRAIRKGSELLRKIEGTCLDPLILPVDSHCVLIGRKTIVSLREYCGRQVFERERGAALTRRQEEDRVFFADTSVKWVAPLDAEALEVLCAELLRREPGVMRAKLIGRTNDRDAGRDIIVDCNLPQVHAGAGEGSNSIRESDPPRKIRILVQVKSRSKTIGKQHVRDIRDTIEHHKAEGFLLVAYPRISAPLISHLEGLRERNVYVNWWEADDLEDRLRRHPDIAQRFSTVVTLQHRAT